VRPIGASRRAELLDQVASATLDPALGNSVLPGTLERRANRPDGHRAYRDRDLQTIFGVSIKDEEPRSRLIREGLAQLLDDPTGGRMGQTKAVPLTDVEDTWNKDSGASRVVFVVRQNLQASASL